ncbi:hypothetical protein Ga0080574_TMP5098 (plasmid) [Salipiger abyssi]|uniref:Uncharacterized protein n=1 Tax=Salipiger abyssi TaxID=1250539 RepID=A0A1P8V152_9RHOB|nr:hypothetical protein Ga0080574_TMP5098 [Salipiger abyssi]
MRGRRREIAWTDRRADLVHREPVAQVAARRIGHRHGGHELPRIRMRWRLENRTARPDLDDPAEIHHRDAVADPLHHRHVVADEEIGEPALALQRHHQVDDLRLDRHVQRRNRLVGDHQRGIECQSAGNGDALALSARELVRKALCHLGFQPDIAQKPAHRLFQRGARGAAMHAQRLGQKLAHAHARIEAGERILKHHLEPVAEVLARHRIGAHRGEIAKPDLPAAHPVQPHDRARRGALARTGLAHQRERLARGDAKGDILDRVHPPGQPVQHSAMHVEAHRQILDPQQRSAARRLGRGVLRRRDRQAGAVVDELEGFRQLGAVHRAQTRDRGEQRLGVGFVRGGKDLLGAAALDQIAAIHHRRAVRDLGHHAHVMGDEHHRHALFVLKLLDQFDDLRLNRHVERRGRLVGNQELRLAGQRHGDGHALPHAAGKLVRVILQPLRR